MRAMGRPTLSREAIAAKALEMTDEAGLSGLSMRKLGAEFGVEAMSLYHYVKNKDDLLDAVLERLYLEIELPVDVPLNDWEQATRRGLRAFLDVLVRHPAALDLFATRSTPSLEAFSVLMWSFNRFQNVGLDVVDAHAAFHFSVSFVIGFAASELGSLAQLRSEGGLPPEEADDPVVAETLRRIQSVTSEEIFESGLDMLVAGLRTRFELP